MHSWESDTGSNAVTQRLMGKWWRNGNQWVGTRTNSNFHRIKPVLFTATKSQTAKKSIFTAPAWLVWQCRSSLVPETTMKMMKMMTTRMANPPPWRTHPEWPRTPRCCSATSARQTYWRSCSSPPPPSCPPTASSASSSCSGTRSWPAAPSGPNDLRSRNASDGKCTYSKRKWRNLLIFDDRPSLWGKKVSFLFHHYLSFIFLSKACTIVLRNSAAFHTFFFSFSTLLPRKWKPLRVKLNEGSPHTGTSTTQPYVAHTLSQTRVNILWKQKEVSEYFASV